MEKEYIEREAAINVVANNPHNVAFKTIKTIQGIKEIPTADVVPKSEVEWLYKQVDCLSQEVMYNDDIAKMKVDEAKTEIAREIFEEIEKKSSSCVAVQNGYEHYETKTYTISALKLDELKKKYTGEKGEEKDNGRA